MDKCWCGETPRSYVRAEQIFAAEHQKCARAYVAGLRWAGQQVHGEQVGAITTGATLRLIETAIAAVERGGKEGA